MINLKINFNMNDVIHGFRVVNITPLFELNFTAIQLEHIKTGARIMHFYADDSENLFSINFPTPPPDDTGVPHIMEHSVLSGSQKYPVRDPFFEMVKMSMATFINAMTGWDCTYYPVASNVKQDLFNLAEVYFDAVFHPLLTEQTFRREAHHLMPKNPRQPTGELTLNGVVYNEMKGTFSDPESRLYRGMSRALFPDSIYGRESGGDPESIPDLTYQAFKKFFEDHYHPSNAYFFIYGDIPTEEYLIFLKDKLDAFERREVRVKISQQPRWDSPRRMQDFYPIGSSESPEEKTYVVINWLVGSGIDALDVAQLYILSNILLGNEAAPLKKAIIDSKLGQDLIYSGFRSVGLESVFTVGLKGTEPDRADRFERLVFDTLNQLAQEEFDRERVAAAFQQAAYHYREILPSYPLHLMDRVVNVWIQGGDPLTFVRMNEHLKTCQQKYQENPALFNQLIKERLLDNPHRLTYLMLPDKDLEAREEAAFAQRMKQVRSQFNEEQLKRIAREAKRLERESGTPNSPEALATLPQLKVSEIPRQPKHIPTTIERLAKGVELLINDVFANGVNYLYLDFNLTGLPKNLWEYMPRYVDAINKLGAAGMNYEQIASRVAAHTGGIDCWTYFTTHATEPQRSVWGLRFSLKSLDEQIDPAMELLRDLIFAVDPRDKERLRDVVVQARAHYRTELVQDGSGTASRHAARGLSAEAYLAEIIHGLPQLALTEQLVDDFDQRFSELIGHIEAVRDFILNPRRLTASFTGSDYAAERVRQHLTSWIQQMNDQPITPAALEFVPYQQPPREGLASPMQVAYCSQVVPGWHISHPDSVLLKLGTRIISSEYMLNEIRFKGNAYGAWASYDGLDQEFELSSYRDPHIARTLQVFENLMQYVQQADWTQGDVDRAIIGAAKHYHKPLRPKTATRKALHRHLTGQTPQFREAQFDRILSAAAKQVTRATLDFLLENWQRSAVCVVSSREKLAQANRQLKKGKLSIRDLLNSSHKDQG
ncbi:MAG: insulinase family protein [candidate division KSB1 bacterium]|nr:insulinase family protein [candidate division KSB1 bacterium]MDZ7356112.1 insulinase family protein [candidate division KSB1 bacterium]MDZ7398911.1 insulinase family protein [candidate division KSB1 bacterium]